MCKGPAVGFEDLVDIVSGISVDLSNPFCPKFSLEEKERERLLRMMVWGWRKEKLLKQR